MTAATPQVQSTFLDAALSYIKRGWPVLPLHFPVSPNLACSCGYAPGEGKKNPCRPYKHPYGQFVPSGLKGATLNENVVKDWLGKLPVNLGILTGRTSGLVVIDIDIKHFSDIDEARDILHSEHNLVLDPTYVVSTHSGGFHYYYKCDFEMHAIRSSQGALVKGIDIRGIEGYVVAPPSITNIGAYNVVAKKRIAHLSKSWIDALSITNKSRGALDLRQEEMIPHGHQHDTLLSYGGTLRAIGFGEEEIFAALMAMNNSRFEKPGTEKAIRAAAQYAASKEIRPHMTPAEMLRNIAKDHPSLIDVEMHRPPQVQPSENGTSHGTQSNDDDTNDFKPLPDHIFSLLPKGLRRICDLLPIKYERDVFLTGALPVLAALCPNVYIKYGRIWQGLNLYKCVVAEASGGKGTLRLSRMLAEPTNEKLKQESIERISEWFEKKEDGEKGLGKKPSMMQIFLAGDNSAPAFKESLSTNPHALIFETEIKTLSQALGQEWGQFRDMLLKSFHAEPIISDRKGTELVTIERPALSLCMSGTPGSFEGILKDTEDGLFSRMCFYHFDANPEFTDQFGSDTDDELDEKIRTMAELLPQMFEQLRTRAVPLYMHMAKTDQKRVVATGKEAMRMLLKSGADPNMQANIKRSALVAYRIASILSLLRLHLDSRALLFDVKSVEITSVDVTIGLSLAFSYLEHALKISEMLAIGHTKLRERRFQFLSQLPVGDFNTRQAYRVGEDLGIPKRTIRHYLKTYSDKGSLVDLGYDMYRKERNPLDLTVPSFRSIIT